MSYLFLKPNDPLFFRDGKPFTQGEDSTGNSLVIPPPSVVWGAMFTTLLAHKLVEKSDIDKLQVKNLFLYNSAHKSLLVPTPLDMFIDEQKNACYQKYKSTKSEDWINPISEHYNEVILPDSTENVETASNTFISYQSLIEGYSSRYDYNTITILDSTSFSAPYFKLGINRNNTTFTTDEGALYRIDMVEYLDDWGILVEYESDVLFPSRGVLRLGGEGKTAKFESIEKPYEITASSHANIVSNKFKIYLQTPSFIPCDFSPQLKKINCIIETNLLGKRISIGGFDILNKRPKQMNRAIAAGSIYVIKSTEEKTLDDWQTNIQNILAPLNTNGFGAFHILPFNP